jgi:hypothetical protein
MTATTMISRGALLFGILPLGLVIIGGPKEARTGVDLQAGGWPEHRRRLPAAARREGRTRRPAAVRVAGRGVPVPGRRRPSAERNKNGFGAGEFVPYLSVSYRVPAGGRRAGQGDLHR